MLQVWIRLQYHGRKRTKASKISKYAENTTIQNRWPMIFRHEYIQLVYLRENGYDNINYKKKSTNYIPMFRESACSYCHLEFKSENSLYFATVILQQIMKCVNG